MVWRLILTFALAHQLTGAAHAGGGPRRRAKQHDSSSPDRVAREARSRGQERATLPRRRPSFRPPSRRAVIAELRAHGRGWLAKSIGRYAGLIDDGQYQHEVEVVLERRFGTMDRRVWFRDLPVVDLPVGSATHSSQDGYTAEKLLGMLTPRGAVKMDENQTTGVVLAIHDRARNRVMIYDGNHRYADATLRRLPTVRARILRLDPGSIGRDE